MDEQRIKDHYPLNSLSKCAISVFSILVKMLKFWWPWAPDACQHTIVNKNRLTMCILPTMYIFLHCQVEKLNGKKNLSRLKFKLRTPAVSHRLQHIAIYGSFPTLTSRRAHFGLAAHENET